MKAGLKAFCERGPRRLLFLAGSVWIGTGLAAAIVAYLSFATTFPAWLATRIGGRPEDIYGHWLLVLMGCLFCVNVLFASWTRVRLNWANAGTWCGHLGLLILAGGAGWYAVTSQSGQAVSVRTPDGWTAVEAFYLNRTAEVCCSTVDVDGRSRDAVMTGLPPGVVRKGRPDQSLEVPISGGPDGVTIRATAFLPSASVMLQWANDSPNAVSAVSIIIAEDAFWQQTVLCDRVGWAGSFGRPGYSVVHRSGVSPEMLARICDPDDPVRRPDIADDLLLILTGPEIVPSLAVIRPGGPGEKIELVEGRRVPIKAGGRTVLLELRALLTNAACLGTILPAGPDSLADTITPAVRVDLSAGRWTRSIWLPLTEFAGIEPRASQRVDLPGGKAVTLSVSRRRKSLAQSVEIARAVYEVQPDSSMPKDFRCEVRLSAGRSGVIALNRPLRTGLYQISQGSWLPSPQRVEQIVFMVSSRPGLGAIWSGCLLIAIAMPYAFYVKPLILRRRRMAV